MRPRPNLPRLALDFALDLTRHAGYDLYLITVAVLLSLFGVAFLTVRSARFPRHRSIGVALTHILEIALTILEP